MMIEVMTVVISAIAEEQGSDVVKKKTRSPQDPAADLLSGEEDSEKYFIKLPHAPIRNATRRSRWPP